jgi:hypothetical protein
LHDITVIASASIDHQVEGRVNHSASIFGVKILHHFGGSLDVREQRGHRLALAVQRRGGFFFNHANGGHRLGRGRFDPCRCGVAVKCGGALATEIKFRGIFEGTIWALQAERSPAFPAELHPLVHRIGDQLCAGCAIMIFP